MIRFLVYLLVLAGLTYASSYKEDLLISIGHSKNVITKAAEEYKEEGFDIFVHTMNAYHEAMVRIEKDIKSLPDDITKENENYHIDEAIAVGLYLPTLTNSSLLREYYKTSALNTIVEMQLNKEEHSPKIEALKKVITDVIKQEALVQSLSSVPEINKTTLKIPIHELDKLYQKMIGMTTAFSHPSDFISKTLIKNLHKFIDDSKADNKGGDLSLLEKELNIFAICDTELWNLLPIDSLEKMDNFLKKSPEHFTTLSSLQKSLSTYNVFCSFRKCKIV